MITRTIDGPTGPFLIPGEPEVRTQCSEICCRHVFEGEYNYERSTIESVHSVVDVGCNVGSFAVWACSVWWPGQIEEYYGYDPNAEAVELARQNCRNVAVRSRSFTCAAVTSNPALWVSGRPMALFKEHQDWGGSRTHREIDGVQVPVVHPKDLPMADVLKVDAEGVDPEIFYHYPHMRTVKVAMFEYHDAGDREPIEWICRENRLTQVRHHGSPPRQGIQVWVRK